jgi:hypothetical protein
MHFENILLFVLMRETVICPAVADSTDSRIKVVGMVAITAAQLRRGCCWLRM